jgi:hypothetical protein
MIIGVAVRPASTGDINPEWKSGISHESLKRQFIDIQFLLSFFATHTGFDMQDHMEALDRLRLAVPLLL